MNFRLISIIILSSIFIYFSFSFTYQFVKPIPKKELTIASGLKDGKYHKLALLYKEILQKENVKVNIITSEGSVENIKLLDENKAQLAFVQNGIIENHQNKNIQSLASIYYEPLWVFYKNNSYTIDYIIELTSKKISIGKEGSGTKNLASKILSSNNITTENSQIFNFSNNEAKNKLLSGKIDAMFLVAGYDSKIVKELLENPSINILNIKRAHAYSQKYTFLETLNLYEGTIDLYKNLPDSDIKLLATTATLVANEHLPEELTRLILKKIKEIHKEKNLFSKDSQFPNTQNLTLQLNEEAQRYFTYGDSFLEKIFPYWIASNIDRLKILLIPLLTLLIPLFKGLLPLYKWSIRSKIYKWYKQLKQIESQVDEISKKQIDEKIEELEELRKEIYKETKVPLSYMNEYYNLQIHLDLIKKKIDEKR